MGSSPFYGTAWFNNRPEGVVYNGNWVVGFKGDMPSSVVIRDGTIGIADDTFRWQHNLTSVTVPSSVTYIGEGEFTGCSSALVIRCYENSHAHRYAVENNMRFELIGASTAVPPTTPPTTPPTDWEFYDFGDGAGLYWLSFRVGETGSWQEVTRWNEIVSGSLYETYLSIPADTAFPIFIYFAFDAGNATASRFRGISYSTETEPIGVQFRGLDDVFDITFTEGNRRTTYYIYAGSQSASNASGAPANNDQNMSNSSSSGWVSLRNFSFRLGGEGEWISFDSFSGIHFSDIGFSFVGNLAMPESAIYPINVDIAYSVDAGTTVTLDGHPFAPSYTRENPLTLTLQDRDTMLLFMLTQGGTRTPWVFYTNNPIGRTPQRTTRTEGNWEYTTLQGRATLESYNGPGGHVVVPSTIGGFPVVEIGVWAFEPVREMLTSVTIPNSVTHLARFAFRGCSALTSVTLPNSLVFIGEGAFFDCEAFTSIVIPDSVAIIGRDAFRGCGSLTTVTLGRGVTHIYMGAFTNCVSLTTINLPEGLLVIGQEAFLGCTSLRTITIPRNTDVFHAAFARGFTQPNSQGEALPLQNLTMRVYEGSEAHQYAIWYNMNFEFIAGSATTPPRVSGALGDVLYTDVRALINGQAIPSYNIDGNTMVVAEDLMSYGFGVVWNGTARTLHVTSFDANAPVNPMSIPQNQRPTGTFRMNYLATDIKTFINGVEVTGYNIDGQTIIQFDHLSAYGDVAWDGATRTISLVTR
jgi:hypothetical protein